MQFERYIVISPRQIRGFGIAKGQVLLELDVSDEQTGLAPGLGLMIEMAPSEARELAAILNRKAAEAEDG